MEIKPCPFCGEEKDIEVFPSYGRYFTACINCGSESATVESKTEAIEKWNQRPYDFDMPAIVKKVQRLEKENEQLKNMLALGVDYADR